MQVPAEAVEALKRGNKIEAIKLTRASTGMGLKDAKDAVEAVIADDAAIRMAYESNAPATSGSCLPVVVAVLVTVAVLYLIFG